MRSKDWTYENTVTYHVLKATEGGPGQANTIRMLRDHGIECRTATSHFIGNTAVEVRGGKRTQKRAEKLIFG